jgi:transposase
VIDDLAAFFDASLAMISGKSELAGAVRYARSRWSALTRYLDDGRLEISNNAAERAIRPLALGRKNYLFAGSDAGGERAAAAYTLIESALCRARHKAVYADIRTMPNGSGTTRRCDSFAGRRADFVAVPFGIVCHL